MAARRAAGKAAKEGLDVADSALKSFLSRAKDAIKAGAKKTVVAPIVASVKAGTATVKAADKKLIDIVTRQNRRASGQAYKPGKIGPDGKKLGDTFQGPADIATRRNIARGGVYGGAATGVAVAGDAVKKPTKKEQAAEARKASQERSDGQVDGLTAALKKKEAEKKKRARLARNRKMQAAVNATNPGAPKKGKGKGKGKLFPKVRPFGGVIARALLGDDEKFGGERGMIDFIRTKKKNKGGMMKKPVKKNMGGMMKKKEAPSRPTGYMNGGMATKTSARGNKPKGCGAATGGYGKAML